MLVEKHQHRQKMQTNALLALQTLGYGVRVINANQRKSTQLTMRKHLVVIILYFWFLWGDQGVGAKNN
jgi:hypothetical protein